MSESATHVQAAVPALGRKRVGLALGGGGMRGMAHVGVLHVLEREGIPIDCVAGTSVGSLVGAAYAAGLGAQELQEFAGRVRWRDIAGLAWPRRGLVSFEKLERLLVRILGDLTFADLRVPYAALAADMATGEPVVLTEGRLAAAVRASCSVQGVVIPVEIGGRPLSDGGVLNNLPISIVRGLGADVVIAVGLGVPPGTLPGNALQMAVAAVDYLLMGAGDDPATAEVYLSVPLWGLASIVRTSHRDQFVALGQQVAEEMLPAIRAALA